MLYENSVFIATIMYVAYWYITIKIRYHKKESLHLLLERARRFTSFENCMTFFCFSLVRRGLCKAIYSLSTLTPLASTAIILHNSVGKLFSRQTSLLVSCKIRHPVYARVTLPRSVLHSKSRESYGHASYVKNKLLITM